MIFAVGEMSFAIGEMSFAFVEMSFNHFGWNEFRSKSTKKHVDSLICPKKLEISWNGGKNINSPKRLELSQITGVS